MRITLARAPLTLLAVAALAVGASSSGATTAPTGGSALKIGLVTDVGTLNDKIFYQYSWEGTQDGASTIGAPAPKSAQSSVCAVIAINM